MRNDVPHRVRDVRAALVLSTVLPVALTSCALIGSQTHTCAIDRALPSGVTTFRPPGDLRWHRVQLGGRARRFAIARADGALELDGRYVSWDQYLMGPLVPIFPVLMGAGTSVGRVEIELRAHRNRAPLRIRPGDFRVRETGASEWLPPTASGPVRSYGAPRDAKRWPLDADVELDAGEGLWVEFPLPTWPEREFTVLVPAGTGTGAESLELPMGIETTPLFFWGL